MPMLGDESELHRASLAKNAAAFFRMSRSARSLAFSLRSRSISSCSGFSWPWPGKACIGSALSSFAQRRSMFSSISRSRAACATLTPRSRISRTASTLNSRANTRLPMGHLQLQQSPFLGVHETGSRPDRRPDDENALGRSVDCAHLLEAVGRPAQDSGLPEGPRDQFGIKPSANLPSPRLRRNEPFPFEALALAPAGAVRNSASLTIVELFKPIVAMRLDKP